jgi:hypothetical protein
MITHLNQKKYKTFINNITFKNINNEFSLGKYGKLDVIIMKSKSYINATHLCNYFDKQFRHWKENKQSQNLLTGLSELIGIPKEKLIITIKSVTNRLRGTYVHSKLISNIAGWASPKFALTICNIVDKYMENKALLKKEKIIKKQKMSIKKKDQLLEKRDLSIKKKDKSIKKKDQLLEKKECKIDVMSKKMDKLLDTNKKMDTKLKHLMKSNNTIINQNDEISNKLDSACDARVVPTGRSRDVNHLIIVHNNINYDDYKKNDIVYDYSVLRVIKNNSTSLLNKHKIRYPNMVTILNIDGSPNAVILWKRIRGKLNEKIEVNGCNFNLKKKYTKPMLIRDIRDVHAERFSHEDL